MNPPIPTLLLTGAAGALGRVLAPALQAVTPCLVVSDLPEALAATNRAGAPTRKTRRGPMATAA